MKKQFRYKSFDDSNRIHYPDRKEAIKLEIKWKIVLIVLMLILMFFTVTSPLTITDGYAEIIELPMEGELSEIRWENYVSSDEYKDPSLHVQIFEGNDFCVSRKDKSGKAQEHHTRYIYAVVKIANASQIRSSFIGKASNDQTAKGFRIASANHAVIAINGDYFSHPYHKDTYIVRQGHEYKTSHVNKKWDLLIIDQNGDFHVIVEPTSKKLDSWIKTNITDGGLKIINTFNFGPVLIDNYENARRDLNKTMNHDYIGSAKLAQRMCICQLDNLTYLIVTSEGPDNEKDAGLTLNEFVQLLREIEGDLDGYRIRVAFNLDGGNSATLVFKDPQRNGLKKINGLNNKNAERWIKDIIYFASAWEE